MSVQWIHKVSLEYPCAEYNQEAIWVIPMIPREEMGCPHVDYVYESCLFVKEGEFGPKNL